MIFKQRTAAHQGRFRFAWLLAAAAIGVSQPASGAALYAFTETGGNVVGTLSGKIDTTGLDFRRTGSFLLSFIQPNIPELFSRNADHDFYEDGSFSTFFPSFGPGAGAAVGTASGDPFGFGEGGFLLLPEGYASNTDFNGGIVFENATLASLGVIPDTYVGTLRNGDTVTVSFTPAPIPLPAAAPMLLAGLGGLALLRRHRARSVKDLLP